MVADARGPSRHASCWRPTTSRSRSRCGRTRSWPTPRCSPSACRWPLTAIPACPRRWCSRSPSTCTPRRCGSEGAVIAQSRAAMLVSRTLDPQAGRAGARPVRGARRQDDPSGRADGGRRARSWPSSATAAARARWPARPSGCAPANVRVEVADAAEPRAEAAVRPRARGSALQRAWEPCRRAPTCAGECSEETLGALARSQRGRSSTPGPLPSVREDCLSTLRARSLRLRTSARSPPSWIPAPDFEPVGRGRCRRCPHRDRTAGFFIAALRRGVGGDGGRSGRDRRRRRSTSGRCARTAASRGCDPRTSPAATAASTACTASSSARCAPTAASTRRSCGCPRRRSLKCNNCGDTMLQAV